MPTYEEIWAGPGRNVKRVNGQPQITSKWYITIHNTSNNATARAEANYAKVRTDGVGAHYFIDNIEVLQSTDTDWCVGHVGSTQGNSRGISYEITGVNGWTREQWMANVAWKELAAVIARDCAQFGIPVRLLTLDQMRAFNSSNKGFVTHNMCRLAWGGTTHTDPGPNFPMDHLLALVGQHLNGDDMEPTDKVGYATNASRSYGQGWTDAFNLRDWEIGAGKLVPGAAEGQWPAKGSPAWNLANLPQLLKEHAAAPVDLEALMEALRPELDAAAERAVRKVLGSLDGATPAG